MSTAILRYLIVSVAIFIAGWMANGWRLGEKIAQMERDTARSETTAALDAAIQTADWNKQLEDARNDATKREQALRHAAVGARSAADGLRAKLAEAERSLPELTEQAVRQYAAALGDVFGECTERYTAVAEKAGGHASDVQTLMDGWPK